MPPHRLGERLVADGLLTPAAVTRALGFQRSISPRVRLGSILLTWDLIDEGGLLKALAALHRCEAVTGEMLAAAPVEVVRLLPAAHAIRLNAIPYALLRSRIRVAFVDPGDVRAIDEVSALTGHACVPGVVTELRLLQAHRRFYGRVLPIELRPTSSVARPDAARASRADVPAPRSAEPVSVPVAVPAAAMAPAELAPITVPDLPIPPRPTPARRTPVSAVPQPPAVAAAAPAHAPQQSAPPAFEPGPGGMWIASRPDLPTSEVALGLWSRASAPPPISEEEFADIALAFVPPEFPRAVLLTVDRGELVGWPRGVEASAPGEIRLSSDDPSVFATVLRTGTPHFGRVDESLWPRPLARRIEGPPPCVVFPVNSAGGVAALLYADRRGAPMRFEDTALLARAAAEIAALFERDTPRDGH